MDFERGLGKRGQEGVTLTTLLLIILGVIAVVVVILYFTGFFSKLNTATGNLPSDLQAAVSTCELAGSNGLRADYCSAYRKVTINGVEQYQTCDMLKEYTADNKEINDCGAAPSATDFCTAKKLGKGTKVGNTPCS